MARDVRSGCYTMRPIAIPQVGGLHHRYERAAASPRPLPLFAMACDAYVRPFSDSPVIVEAAYAIQR